MDNRKRAFAEVVSIEAWHRPFDHANPTADLHADVVFGTARVGGEAESPVRFRLRMKRAEIVIAIPESEPISVDKQSVSRDAPQLRARITNTTERLESSGIRANAQAKFSSREISGSLEAGALAKTQLASTHKIEVSGEIGPMLITQSKTAEGDYRWTIEPSAGTYLEGRPWDGGKEPRLKLVDHRKDRSKGIPPTVRVEVRCKREDIDISDITIKDETLLEKAKSQIGFTNKMKAAEAYIRNQLANEGLEVSNVSDIFGQLTFASTTAEPLVVR
ncbi:MAG TPA: hypothetical protein VGF56_14710 [Rhizomicrobium sp.]